MLGENPVDFIRTGKFQQGLAGGDHYGHLLRIILKGGCWMGPQESGKKLFDFFPDLGFQVPWGSLMPPWGSVCPF